MAQSFFLFPTVQFSHLKQFLFHCAFIAVILSSFCLNDLMDPSVILMVSCKHFRGAQNSLLLS